MEILAFFINAYLYIFIYDAFTEENEHFTKWFFVFAIGILKCIAEAITYTKQLIPLIVCTLLVFYSICIKTYNSNLQNLKYAVLTYGMVFVINVVLASSISIIVGLGEISATKYMYLFTCVGRLVVIWIMYKGKLMFWELKKDWILNIGSIATVVFLFTEQVFRVAYSNDNRVFSTLGVACTYLAALFTILWLIDHYKMAKIQEMYADDNQQMSQKLHRSKEILPMIANYVSSMDAVPDERMRKKLEEVCDDYGKELGGMEMCAEFIETTGIDLVDLLLRTKIMECSEQDIELNVFVSTQIDEDMKQLDISDGEITRLLGDLLRNAIHAVSNLQNKMILLLIARDENGYVLIRIYDSGIPFPPYVLERFGERGNTTWGTGNGLADMMETLRRVHASIEINLDMESGDVFTKGIFICFDGEDNVNITQRKEYPGDAEGRVCF